MTDLRARMHDTVDHHHADLAELATRARREGTTLRRRHRAAVLASVVAVVAVAGAGAVGAAGLLPDRDTGRAVPVAGQGGGQDGGLGGGGATKHAAKPAPRSVDGNVATGRTTVSALYAAVTAVVPGTGSDFQGQGALGGSPDTWGGFALAPADGSGAGRVEVNVQNKSILAQDGTSAEEGFVCLGFMEACRLSTLPDGSLLRTYAEHSVAANGVGTGERLVAERLVGDVRVVASAANGFELPANEWDITRPDAVLSVEQLTSVVSQPWWGFRLPDQPDVPTYTEIPTS